MTKQAEVKGPRSAQAIATQWPEFVADVKARLEQGARDYGDKSFTKSPSALIGEIKQELLDVCGWGFILWDRLDRAERALAVATAKLKERAKVSTCQSADMIAFTVARKARRARRSAR